MYDHKHQHHIFKMLTQTLRAIKWIQNLEYVYYTYIFNEGVLMIFALSVVVFVVVSIIHLQLFIIRINDMRGKVLLLYSKTLINKIHFKSFVIM